MFPIELLSLAGGGIFGAIIGLIRLKMELNAQKEEALLNRAGVVQDAREFGLKSKRFAITRQIIALGLLATITSTMWAPLLIDTLPSVTVPLIEEGSTFSILFGIFEYIPADKVEYMRMAGPTVLSQHLHFFAAVMGLYFGADAASRR